MSTTQCVLLLTLLCLYRALALWGRRRRRQIETFCFEAGGNMDVSVRDFTARGRDGKPTPGVRAGFLMVPTATLLQAPFPRLEAWPLSPVVLLRRLSYIRPLPLLRRGCR